MRNLISAELLKLRTTRAFWAYVASIVVVRPDQHRIVDHRRERPEPADHQ